MPFRLAGRRLGRNIFFHEVDEVDYPLFSGPLYTLSLASKIHQIALAEKLDIVHAHYAIPHAAGAWLGQQTLGGKIKLVTTLHGTDITLVGKAPSFQPVVRFVIDRSDAVTTVSEWLAGETRRTFGVDRPIEVIHNFIDPERFKRAPDPELRARFAAPDEKIVLHVSNFRPVKRVQDVVKAFAGIVRSGVKAKLLMVGDGPTRGCASDLARELGVMDRAWFLGKADPVEDFFAIADLFLFPSEYESFGLAALEAMCAETPVVASEGGGLPEVIRRGETGFLRPVGDFEGMAADGAAILRDPEAARAMGLRAREDVSARFATDRIIPRYEALYAGLLDPSHPEFEPCEESLLASGL
jgi:N-acetyl-alpha-D-glucosaminyl L-malate synthase BshA